MKISAGFTKKVMIKQYEPVEVSCFMEEEAVLKNRKEMDEAYELLFQFCKDQVEAKIAEELGLIDVKKEIGHKSDLEAAQDIGSEIVGE